MYRLRSCFAAIPSVTTILLTHLRPQTIPPLNQLDRKPATDLLWSLRGVELDSGDVGLE